MSYKELREKVEILQLQVEMIPEVDIRVGVSNLINLISEAWVDGNITDEENNELVTALR